ncbi:MAG: lipoxygenase family protein [Rhizobiaceae bacterium]
MSNDLALPFSWKMRSSIWNKFLDLKYKGAKPAHIPVPEQQDRKIKPVPIGDYYPSLNIGNVLVADHIPADEAQPLKRKAVSFQTWLSGRFSQMQDGLPPISADPFTAMDTAYSSGRSKLFPKPQLPDSLSMADSAAMLGRLAVEGPFAGYLEGGENGYHWNTTYLNDPDFTLRNGTEKVGARVDFEVERNSRTLRAASIRTALGEFTPDDEEWPHAVKTALCGVSNDISIVRHFSWVHLIGGSFLAIATRNQLSASHPVRRLLWPHMYRTQYSNDMITEVLLGPLGDFANMFTFNAEGISALISKTYGDYPIETAHPYLDAMRRGISGADFDTPSQHNLEALFDVFLRHTSRYIDTYYESDDALATDQEVKAWLDELDTLIPGGTDPIVSGKTPRQAMAELCASMIYIGTVQHEVLGTNLWNYQMWTQIIPSRIYTNRQREPVDVFQRLLNANLNLNIYRAQLMRDFTYLAIDEAGREVFRQFLGDLEALNRDMRQHPDAHWKIYPDILEANMNA